MLMRSLRFLKDSASGSCEVRSMSHFFLFDACKETQLEGSKGGKYIALMKII